MASTGVQKGPIYPFLPFGWHDKRLGVPLHNLGIRMPFDWATQSLRLSIFSDAPVIVTEKDWKTITGQDEADIRTVVPGGKSYIGNYSGAQLALAYSGPRIDILLSPSAVAEESLENQKSLPGIIGPWTEHAETFPKALSGYLGGLQFPVVRLAFGSILLCEAASHEDAYEKLDELLESVDVDPNKMRELIYRINWPQMSKVIEELELNRITNWSAIRFTQNLLQLTGPQVSMTSSGVHRHAVRLEIDHNTGVDNKRPFERNELMPIFDELVMLARENAVSGERP
jgi:hypothetical protein